MILWYCNRMVFTRVMWKEEGAGAAFGVCLCGFGQRVTKCGVGRYLMDGGRVGRRDADGHTTPTPRGRQRLSVFVKVWVVCHGVM